MKTIIEDLIEDPLNLVSFIETLDNSNWYLIPFDYWVMNHWGQFGISESLSHEEQELLFLEKVEKYKIEMELLSDSYKENRKLENLLPIELIEPRVYANFKSKTIISAYVDGMIQPSILSSWSGECKIVKDLIPIKYRYWEE